MDSQESQIFTAILTAILVIGSIIGYFVTSAIKHQKRVAALERKNARAEITALENDRARIADDIHDDLAPMLVSIKMKISTFELSDYEDNIQLHATYETIDEMAKRLRAISFDLMPATLKAKGLFIAIKEFVTSVSKDDSFKIRLSLPEEQLYFEEHKTINCYRILKEIIHNTIKHAQASELYIVLERGSSSLIISTRDNGGGFNYEKKLYTGLGLRSLQNRVNLMGGEIHLESKEGMGTAYHIIIPIFNA